MATSRPPGYFPAAFLTEPEDGTGGFTESYAVPRSLARSLLPIPADMGWRTVVEVVLLLSAFVAAGLLVGLLVTGAL